MAAMAAAMPFSNMAGLVIYGHKEKRKRGDKEEKGKKRKKKETKKDKKEEKRMNYFLKQSIKDGAGTF